MAQYPKGFNFHPQVTQVTTAQLALTLLSIQRGKANIFFKKKEEDFMIMYEPYWGMHLFWWAFWIIAMISIFGFNVPERTRINSLDPHMILKRRRAKGEISEDEYNRIQAQFFRDEQTMKQDVATQTTHAKLPGHPMVDGLSFSATWVIFYSICGLAYWVAPNATMTAISKLFHGMSFAPTAQLGTAFGFSDFISVLTLGAVYTFIAGIVWSLTHSFFLRQKAELWLARHENRTVQKTHLNPR